MIILYTTERDYPWGTLRSTHASKTKVVLEEKGIQYRIENLSPGNLWKKPPEMLHVIRSARFRISRKTAAPFSTPR